MEFFRRFVAGIDPFLQAKCHEQGAATLEGALSVACKWECAQETLKLLSPPAFSPELSPSAPQDEPLTAMVSTKHEKSHSDKSFGIIEVVK